MRRVVLRGAVAAVAAVAASSAESPLRFRKRTRLNHVGLPKVRLRFGVGLGMYELR